MAISKNLQQYLLDNNVKTLQQFKKNFVPKPNTVTGTERAKEEIETVSHFGNLIEMSKTPDEARKYWAKLVQLSKSFKDVGNNNIGDFLIINTRDNFPYDGDIADGNIANDTFKGIIKDMINAIKGDTDTLLHE